MPFTTEFRSYTRDEILAVGPNQNGVYGIFQRESPIYIGSGDIRDRMLAHFNGDNACITRSKPNQWTGAVVTGDLTHLEGELIQEYRPACNPTGPTVRSRYAYPVPIEPA